jgi:hypothetical protein
MSELRVVKSHERQQQPVEKPEVQPQPDWARADIAYMETLMDRYPKQAMRKARQIRDNQIRGPG